MYLPVPPRLHRVARIFVPARLDDNPFINREDYTKSLLNLDPVTRAHLKGRLGSAFDARRTQARGLAPGQSVTAHSPVIFS
jgi:hypothetical protein